MKINFPKVNEDKAMEMLKSMDSERRWEAPKFDDKFLIDDVLWFLMYYRGYPLTSLNDLIKESGYDEYDVKIKRYVVPFYYYVSSIICYTNVKNLKGELFTAVQIILSSGHYIMFVLDTVSDKSMGDFYTAVSALQISFTYIDGFSYIGLGQLLWHGAGHNLPAPKGHTSTEFPNLQKYTYHHYGKVIKSCGYESTRHAFTMAIYNNWDAMHMLINDLRPRFVRKIINTY